MIFVRFTGEPLNSLLKDCASSSASQESCGFTSSGRAESSGSSIRSLIVRALEETYAEPKKGERVTGPMIRGKGKRGPLYPVDENPHDLIFS